MCLPPLLQPTVSMVTLVSMVTSWLAPTEKEGDWRGGEREEGRRRLRMGEQRDGVGDGGVGGRLKIRVKKVFEQSVAPRTKGRKGL